MKRILLYILTTFTLTVLTNCNNDEKIEGLKSNEILVVTLEILDDIEINEIILTSNGATDKIKGDQIQNKKKIKLKTPQSGEGTFKICVYAKTDTLCSQDSYIEGGYRPKLRLKNNKFETLEWF
ncbi:MAG: hypothetical protein QY303_05240 [Vicingaceae bacterium]|nr:MAG: hypothetical protein QY303_05240 [Vicingaceae bacterium]